VLPFERPYPDELIASALIRGCRHFAITTPTLGRQLGHEARWRTTFLGWSSLQPLSQLFRVSEETLLTEHTLYPYLSAFGSWRESPAAEAARAHPAQRSLPKASLLRSLVSGVSKRRYCEACVKDDLRNRGETYWRRAHHLPGVLVCPTHGSLLKQTARATAGPFNALLLPQDCSGAVTPSHRRTRDDIQHQLIQASLQALHGRAGAARNPRRYLQLAIANGWLTPGQDVSSAKVANTLMAFYGVGFLQSTGVGFPVHTGCWPALMLREGVREPFSTYKHLLLGIFLHQSNRQGELAIAFKRGRPSTSPQARDAIVSAAIREQFRRLTHLGEQATKKELLTGAGCLRVFRHNIKTLPLSRALVAAFQRSALCSRPKVTPDDDPQERGLPSTRSELFRDGRLIDGRTLAERLGVEVAAVRKMRQRGSIFAVPFAGRVLYPTFWSDGTLAQDALEQIARALVAVPGYFAYVFLTSPSLFACNDSPLAIARHDLDRALELCRDFASSYASPAFASDASPPAT